MRFGIGVIKEKDVKKMKKLKNIVRLYNKVLAYRASMAFSPPRALAVSDEGLPIAKRLEDLTDISIQVTPLRHEYLGGWQDALRWVLGKGEVPIEFGKEVSAAVRTYVEKVKRRGTIS